MANNERARKKDSARLVWDSKPRRAPNPRDIEFQTAEVVIPNWVRDSGQIPMSFRDGMFGEQAPDKQQMNRLVWGDNLLAMQALLAQGYEGKINLIYIDPPFCHRNSIISRLLYKWRPWVSLVVNPLLLNGSHTKIPGLVGLTPIWICCIPACN